MKKTISLITALVVIFVSAACGRSEDQKPEEVQGQESDNAGEDKEVGRFDFEKKDIDTEYLIFVTVNTETGKTWLGDNGLTCLEIKDGLVTNPFTGEAMTVDDMLNKN